MNVGMTRARRKLLLVGDSSTLCRHPFFGELLAYVKGVGATAQRMRWADRLDSVMVIAEKRVGEPVSACYASMVSSDTLTARERSWLSRYVQIYEGLLEAESRPLLWHVTGCDRCKTDIRRF
jgi:hypothetical protein